MVLPSRRRGTGEDADADSLAYAWDFGVPGTTSDTSTAKDLSYTYTTPGTYDDTVTASDGRGGTATATVQIIVEQGADVTAPTISDPAPANASTVSDRQPTIAVTVRDDRSQFSTSDLVLYVDGVRPQGQPTTRPPDD